MQEWVSRIVVYVVIVTVLRSLIAKPQYRQYFRFLSGIILILLLASPLLSLFGEDNAWYSMLSKQVFQLDTAETKELLKSSEGALQDMVMEQYRQTIELQVIELGKEEEIAVQETEITLSEEGKLLHMDVKLKEKKTTKASLRSFRQKLCTYYQVGEDVIVLWI